jgi:hypothetical protein
MIAIPPRDGPDAPNPYSWFPVTELQIPYDKASVRHIREVFPKVSSYRRDQHSMLAPSIDPTTGALQCTLTRGCRLSSLGLAPLYTSVPPEVKLFLLSLQTRCFSIRVTVHPIKVLDIICRLIEDLSQEVPFLVSSPPTYVGTLSSFSRSDFQVSERSLAHVSSRYAPNDSATRVQVVCV